MENQTKKWWTAIITCKIDAHLDSLCQHLRQHFLIFASSEDLAKEIIKQLEDKDKSLLRHFASNDPYKKYWPSVQRFKQKTGKDVRLRRDIDINTDIQNLRIGDYTLQLNCLDSDGLLNLNESNKQLEQLKILLRIMQDIYYPRW